jgi:hypothetical protein
MHGGYEMRKATKWEGKECRKGGALECIPSLEDLKTYGMCVGGERGTEGEGRLV